MQFIRGNKFLRFLTITALMLLWITAFNSCTTYNPYKERNNFSASLSTRKLLIRDFLSNIKSANNFIESQYDTARFLQQRGKHLAAIEVLREILSIDPLNVKAYNVIGVSYDFLGEFDLAETAYKSALKIQPDSAYTQNNLGFSYLIQGKYDLSIDAFRQAVDLNDQERKFRNNLGLAYARKGDVNAALAQFQMTGNDAAGHLKLHKAIGNETNFRENNLQKGDAAHFAETSQAAAPPQVKTALQHPGDSSEKEVKSMDIRKPISQYQLIEASTASTLQDDIDGHVWENTSDAALNRARTDQGEVQKSATIQTNRNKPHFSVQVGAFRKEFYAASMKEKISNEGLNVYISEIKNAALEKLYWVRVCCFEDRKKAEKIRHELFERDQIEGFVMLEVSPPDFFCESPHPFSPSNAEKQAIKNDLKVEVFNGNGVNKMAQRVADYLSEKGHSIYRFSNADNFNYPDTIIYYQKDYLHDAYEVAKLIPGYQKMKKLDKFFYHKDVEVRVVIGKDLIKHHDYFHQDYQKPEK